MRSGYLKVSVACAAVVSCLFSMGAQARQDVPPPAVAAEVVEAAEQGQLAAAVETAEVAVAEGAADPVAAATQVYIIREKSFVGGGRGVWIAANDRVVASLSNGSHVRLTLDQAINSINAVQGKAGFAYMALDNRPGETIYARIEYLKGTITEIPADEGAALVAKTKPMTLLDEVRPNDAYDNLLVNPELLGLGLVSTAVEPMTTDEHSAVISFYRPGKLVAQLPFTFWNQDGYAASLYGGQYVQLRVAPGSHRFVGFSERLSVLEMSVEAGKEYAVEFDVGMGWNQAHIKLLPVDTTAQASKIDGWKQTLALVGVDQAALASEKAAPRVAAGFSYLQQNQQKWLSEEAVRRSNTGAGSN